MSFAQGLVKLLDKLPYYTSNSGIIQKRRQENQGRLGIDYLLTACGITSPQQVYPPTTKEKLLQLIDLIETSNNSNDSNIKSFRIRSILYIFFDCSVESPPEAKSIADYFSSEMWISAAESRFVRCIWNLDQGDVDKALPLLGEPWCNENTEFLHEYFVHTIYKSDVKSVANYIASYPYLETKFSRQLIDALALRGDLAEMLNLSRRLQNDETLLRIADESVKSRDNQITFAQLPFSEEEWEVVKQRLFASESKQVASELLLVRSMHTGDADTVKQLQNRKDFEEYLSESNLV